jgi:serine/threonine-protein kinase RsbW
MNVRATVEERSAEAGSRSSTAREDKDINAGNAATKSVAFPSGGLNWVLSTMSNEMDSRSDVCPPFTTTRVIPSDAAEARRVQEEIEEALRAQAYSPHEIFGIKLALEEALVNAIKHGNQMDRSKTVQIAYRVTAERFDVLVADQGPGFDPADVPDPTAVENLERPSGRGVMLMKHYMNVVGYNESGNSVFMTKYRKHT